LSSRSQNELRFGNWKELPENRRQYWLHIPGKSGWSARYFKEVDSAEKTVRFWQEVYDSSGKLVEIHEKYPVDKGHQKL